MCTTSSQWLSTAFGVLQWTSLLAAACAIASVVVSIQRKWPLARKFARGCVLVCVLELAMTAGTLIYGFNAVASAEAASKATMLAQTISCGMNCSAFVFPSFIVAALVWIIASRRLRA